MKRSLAIRLCKLLTERGISHMMGTSLGELTIIWWDDDMGEQHHITGKSLICEQLWLDREVIK